MGNIYKYNSPPGGAGVSGLTSADGGDAIANNEIIRGDGTDGIQGSVITMADHNGDLTGPTASTDTTIAGQDFANQPSNDGVTVVSDNAGDTTQTVTIIGTTTGTDTVVVENIALNGVVAVNSVKVNWGVILAVKLSVACAGTVTISETSGGLTITTIAAAATSKGVDTGSVSCWNRIPYVVASGATTKQIGFKGTDSTGATIYDSQALTGTTSVLMNSAFVTITEYYIGDLESTRTATVTAIAGLKFNSEFVITGSTGATDNAILRADGTGGATAQSSVVTIADTTGAIRSENGTNGAPTYGFTADQDTGIYSPGDGQIGVAVAGSDAMRWSTTGITVSVGQKFYFADSDTLLYGTGEGSISIGRAANGYATSIKQSTTTVNLAGATSTATGLFPAKCIQLGVSYRVTTIATSGDGGTSINVGDGTDPDRYGATIAFAAGTTGNLSQATADPRGWSASAGDVVFTCNGGTFSGGVVRVVAHFLDLTASTS